MRISMLGMAILLAPLWLTPAVAEEVVEIQGMSIIGNRELPKSLYIVPWKDSEVGIETDLDQDLLDEGLTPVDPDVFARQLDYYELGHK